MLSLIQKAIKNKVVWFVITRYITYGVQFVVSLLCAAKMGPYYFGMWGFMMLILNYMQQINFGISQSANILLVQERNNHQKFAEIESTAFLAQSFLCLGVVFFALGNAFVGYSFMEKYPLGWLFYLICFTAMLAYMVQICMTIYRIKHQLTEIAIYQSSIPLLTLIALFIATGKDLLMWFALAYFIGNLFSFVLFLARGKISLKVQPTFSSLKRLFSKGIYLFIYNSCFYLIIISTRTVVSGFYKVEEFGYFTFAYTLADTVILLLSAITFLLFPKSIEKLHTKNVEQVKHTIEMLRVNYMTLTHGLMYFAFIMFPIIMMIIPKYAPALPAIYMIALALLAHTICCGYPDYLMAQSKDKQIAFVSVVSLFANVVIAVVLAGVLHCPFEYIIIATIISYCVFSILSVYGGMKQMGERIRGIDVIRESFPLRLVFPFVVSCFVIYLGYQWLLPIPLVTFLLFNNKEIKEIFNTLRRLLANPNMLDVVYPESRTIMEKNK